MFLRSFTTRLRKSLPKLPFLKKPKPEPTQEEIEEQAKEDELWKANFMKVAQDPIVLQELDEQGFSSGCITKPDGTKSKYFICGNSMGGMGRDEDNKP